MADTLRETLKRAEPDVGIPGMSADFDRWSADARSYAEAVWPEIADRVLKDYATRLFVDVCFATPIEQRLYLALQARYIGALMDYPHTTGLLIHKKVSEISAFLESKGEPPIANGDYWDYEIDLFLYLDFFLVNVGGKIRRCPPFFVGIECDGRQFHIDPFPFRRDREKDLELGNHGLDIIRLAGSHINDDVDDCVKKIDARVNAHLVRVESWLERCV